MKKTNQLSRQLRIFGDESDWFKDLIVLLLSLLMKQLSNYNSFEGVLYCRPHFDQNFKRTGSLEKSFEGKKAKTDQNVKTLGVGI